MPPQKEPPKNKREMNWGRYSKTFAFWILILLIPVALIQISGNRSGETAKLKFTRYRQELARDNIQSVVIQGGQYVQGEFRARTNIDGREVRRFTVQFPAKDSEKQIEDLAARNVIIEAQDQRPSLTAWILTALPWLLLIGIYLFL